MRLRALILTCLAPLALGGCDGVIWPWEDEARLAEATVIEAPLELTGRVVDTADIIPADAEAAITAQLAALETDLGPQFVVVTTPTLNGYDIADYSLTLARGWGLGSAERNDGLLLVIAPNERRLRIEVGTGLEKPLPDELCAQFIEVITRDFQTGNMVAGIETGVDLLDAELQSKLETTT